MDSLSKRFAPLLMVLPIASMAALPEVPADQSGAKTWEQRQRTRISELLEQDTAEAIPELGEMLRQLKNLNYRECGERDQVVRELQTTLAAIPGHAEYYRDQIINSRDKAMGLLGDQAGSAGHLLTSLTKRRMVSAPLNTCPALKPCACWGNCFRTTG